MLEMPDHRFDRGPSRISPPLLSLTVVALLPARLSGDLYSRRADSSAAAIAAIHQNALEGLPRQPFALLQRLVERVAIVYIIFEARRGDDHAALPQHRYRGFPSELVFLVSLAFGDASSPRVVQAVDLAAIMPLLLENEVDHPQVFGVNEFAHDARLALEVPEQAARNGLHLPPRAAALLGQPVAAGPQAGEKFGNFSRIAPTPSDSFLFAERP